MIFNRSFNCCRNKIFLKCVLSICIKINIILLSIGILSISQRREMASVLISRFTLTFALTSFLKFDKLVCMISICLHYYLFFYKSFLLEWRLRRFSVLKRIKFLFWKINCFIQHLGRYFSSLKLLRWFFFTSCTLEANLFKQSYKLLILEVSPCNRINKLVVYILFSKLAFVIV